MIGAKQVVFTGGKVDWRSRLYNPWVVLANQVANHVSPNHQSNHSANHASNHPSNHSSNPSSNHSSNQPSNPPTRAPVYQHYRSSDPKNCNSNVLAQNGHFAPNPTWIHPKGPFLKPSPPPPGSGRLERMSGPLFIGKVLNYRQNFPNPAWFSPDGC